MAPSAAPHRKPDLAKRRLRRAASVASDARLMLRLIKGENLPVPIRPVHSAHLNATDVTRTTIHAQWQVTEVGAHATDGQYISDALMVACAQMLAPDFPRLQRAVALSAALYDASRIVTNDGKAVAVPTVANFIKNPELSESQVGALVALFKVRGLIDHADEIPQLTQSWRLPDEPQSLAEAIATFVARTHTLPWRMTQTVTAMYELGVAAHFRDIASRAVLLNQQISRQRPEFRPETIAADKVIPWCKAQWLMDGATNTQRATEHRWHLVMADRGFPDEMQMLKRVRRVYAYASLRADQERNVMLFPIETTEAQSASHVPFRSSTRFSLEDAR